MLEYWYKEKRTLVDFRRGPLGPHFDGFAARLKAEDYSSDGAKTVLSKCCQFNAFLIERGIATCGQLTESLIEPFLDVYLVHTRSAGTYYSPRIVARGALKRLFRYLLESKVWQPPKPARIRKPHDWLLHPYLQHLQDECGFSAVTLQRVRAQVGSFLNALGRTAARHRFKTLRAEAVENYLSRHLKASPENLTSLGGSRRSPATASGVSSTGDLDIKPVRV